MHMHIESGELTSDKQVLRKVLAGEGRLLIWRQRKSGAATAADKSVDHRVDTSWLLLIGGLAACCSAKLGILQLLLLIVVGLFCPCVFRILSGSAPFTTEGLFVHSQDLQVLGS